MPGGAGKKFGNFLDVYQANCQRGRRIRNFSRHEVLRIVFPRSVDVDRSWVLPSGKRTVPRIAMARQKRVPIAYLRHEWAFDRIPRIIRFDPVGDPQTSTTRSVRAGPLPIEVARSAQGAGPRKTAWRESTTEDWRLRQNPLGLLAQLLVDQCRKWQDW